MVGLTAEPMNNNHRGVTRHARGGGEKGREREGRRERGVGRGERRKERKE